MFCRTMSARINAYNQDIARRNVCSKGKQKKQRKSSSTRPSVTINNGTLTFADKDGHVVATRHLGRKRQRQGKQDLPITPARRRSSRFEKFRQTFGSVNE